jgi:mannose-1-phosphate guanylyltransferase
VPPVYVGPGAVVGPDARVGSLAVLGAGSSLAEGVIVENSVVGARAKVAARSTIVGSVLGDDVDLGAGCELRNLAVVGPGATLGDGNELDHGLRIGADQRIPEKALRFS